VHALPSYIPKKKRGWGKGFRIYEDDNRTVSVGIGVLDTPKKKKKK
jgi:hypothetical protein